MKRILIVLALSVAILGIAAAVFLIYMRDQATPEPENPDNPFGFSGDGSDADPAPASLEVVLANGSTAQVPDFTKEDQPAIAGPETGYQVSGEVEGKYQILYFPADSYFLVSLFAEPLGEVRREAEHGLRTTLQMTDQQLCELNLDVFVTAEVNESYAGRDLGLSFCPESVPLP